MDCLNTLYSSLVSNDIELYNYNNPDSKGVTIKIDDNYAIFVDYNKLNTLDDEFMIISHEYGHCMSGATHSVFSSLSNIAQNEYKANRYMVHEFLPVESIVEASKKGYCEIWEMAEYLNLPPEFIDKAIHIYKKEGKLH